MNYPASLDNGASLPNPTTGNNTNNPSHAGLHTAENGAIIALEGKVGTGATTPAANQILFGTGAGTSAWQGLTSAQLAAVLSDETGTGSAVFANTPVLITPKVDTINENTPGNGVTISSVNLKSGAISGASLTTTGAATVGNGLTLSAGTFTAPNGSASSKILTNPYKFSVYRAAATTSLSAGAVVPYDTKLFDTSSNLDIVTNKGRFTAPIAGYYWFAASAGNSAALSTAIVISLFKNGARVLIGNQFDPSQVAGGDNSSVVTGLVQLAATDYVEAVFYGGNGSVMAVGADVCWFQGFLVSAT